MVFFRFAALAAFLMLLRAAAFCFSVAIVSPCAGPEFRQFDFWLGDWDTYAITDSSKVVARNRSLVFDIVFRSHRP